MNILAKSIVSNSEMIKNYKACREKAEGFGKIFVLKNSRPDAVLFSISEYERFSVLIEYLENSEEKDIANIIDLLPRKGTRKNYSIDNLASGVKKVAA